MTTTTKGTNPVPHRISWAMKLAFALAFLPIISLLIALATHLPLPIFPLEFGGENDMMFVGLFADNTKQNLAAAVSFSIICLIIGMALFCWLALERHSLRQAFVDVGKNLSEDIRNLSSGLAGTSEKSVASNKPSEKAAKSTPDEPRKGYLIAKRKATTRVPETIL